MINTVKLCELLMNENGFVFDQTTGYTYSINHTGMEVIRWMKDGFNENALAQQLADVYDVEPYTARGDLDAFLATLRGYGLLV
jgi:PqqD family protein of HPr-rel-A system